MTAIAVYLFVVGALAGYRTSKYWPVGLKALPWLRGRWWCWGTTLLATALLVAGYGWTVGLLAASIAYLTALSGVIFFANCRPRIRLFAVVLFHTLCIAGLFLR